MQQKEEHVTKAMVCLRGQEMVSVARRGRVTCKEDRERAAGGERANSEHLLRPEQTQVMEAMGRQCFKERPWTGVKCC